MKPDAFICNASDYVGAERHCPGCIPVFFDKPVQVLRTRLSLVEDALRKITALPPACSHHGRCACTGAKKAAEIARVALEQVEN